MYEIIPVGKVPGGDGFLIVTAQKAALVDGSFAFTAPDVIAQVKKHLSGRALDFVLLTHTHYDHASLSAYAKAEWPQLKVVGSAYGQRVFSRPSAIAVMRELNREAAASFGVFDYPDLLNNLSVDVAVGDGDAVELGDLKLLCVETPGHTRDTVCYFSPSDGFLVAGETLGIPSDEPAVVPCYLVGYRMTLDSIKKAKALEPSRMLMPHYGGILEGERCAKFFDDALHFAQVYKDRVVGAHKAGKNLDEIIAELKAWIYHGTYAKYQPEPAFDLNAGITVRMLLRECEGVEI
jgi:glyoxylase-like metal-dependent hydrolase (beta-lactamase superfamily II)